MTKLMTVLFSLFLASCEGFKTNVLANIESNAVGVAADSERGRRSSNVSADVDWFLNQHEELKKNSFDGKFGVWDNPIGWWEAWYLRAYIDMYEGSKDVRVLRKLNELLKIVEAGNDLKSGHVDEMIGKVVPGWGNTYQGAYGVNGGLRHSDHTLNGLYMYPMAAFARIVKEDSELKNEFDADADRYLLLVENIFDAFAPYTQSAGTYPDGTEGEFHTYPEYYYETYDGRQEYYGTLEKPLNLTLIPAEAYAEAYRAGGKQKFATHAQRVANYVWWNMHYESTNGVTWLYWHYWPAAPAGYYKYMEDLSHGARMIQFTTTMHRSGIQSPWSERGRLQYLANTFKYSLMNSSSTLVWRMNDPSAAQVENHNVYICADWLSLTPYDKDSGSSILTWCNGILKYAHFSKKTYSPIFASFFRYKQ